MDKGLWAEGFLQKQREEHSEEKHFLLMLFYARRGEWGFCKRCQASDTKRTYSGMAAGQTDGEAQLLPYRGFPLWSVFVPFRFWDRVGFSKHSKYLSITVNR